MTRPPLQAVAGLYLTGLAVAAAGYAEMRHSTPLMVIAFVTVAAGLLLILLSHWPDPTPPADTERQRLDALGRARRRATPPNYWEPIALDALDEPEEEDP